MLFSCVRNLADISTFDSNHPRPIQLHADAEVFVLASVRTTLFHQRSQECINFLYATDASAALFGRPRVLLSLRDQETSLLEDGLEEVDLHTKIGPARSLAWRFQVREIFAGAVQPS